MRGAAHHSKMGSDMATREFGRQGGLVRGFLGVARHGVRSSAQCGRFPKVLRIALGSGDRESSNVPIAISRFSPPSWAVARRFEQTPNQPEMDLKSAEADLLCPNRQGMMRGKCTTVRRAQLA